MMSPDDWKKMKEALTHIDYPVEFLCDGFNVTFFLERRDVYHNSIIFYVDGFYKGAWLINDCEERRRFFCRAEKSVWGAKKRALLKKLGKSLLARMVIDPDKKYDTYSSFWTSFGRLKKHLVKNNNDITLIKTGFCKEDFHKHQASTHEDREEGESRDSIEKIAKELLAEENLAKANIAASLLP